LTAAGGDGGRASLHGTALAAIAAPPPEAISAGTMKPAEIVR
jgi:hypothetical protein